MKSKNNIQSIYLGKFVSPIQLKPQKSKQIFLRASVQNVPPAGHFLVHYLSKQGMEAFSKTSSRATNRLCSQREPVDDEHSVIHPNNYGLCTRAPVED